ncbi:hypothetical protein Taro_043145 [Colocasia esculenta]|uniref:DUF7912 domain-containing protein n=1 Tax=Colocasia esculenta TaxID=4460 RepID=A0A843X0X6_COLES|nr:hypothetical protein [Colocasia esculenta]
MRRWCWWRRCSVVQREGRAADRCHLGTEELGALRSLVPRPGRTRPASSLGWVADLGSRPPSRSVAAAAVRAWGTSLHSWSMRKRPAHSAVPCIRSLSTKSAPSRRHVASPVSEDEGKGEGDEPEVEAHRGTRGGRGAEPDMNGSWVEEWEEEEEAEPEIGDGGDGGGIVLGDIGWGERALSIAHEVLRLHFDEDIKLFAFKVSPRGYVYVRLDNFSNQYGCPTMEEIEKFSSLYNKRLEESGESGEIPKDLALEASLYIHLQVSSPGAERLLKVPEDLERFKDMTMVVHYLEEDPESRQRELKEGFFLLEAVDSEAGECVWKLVDVRENRDPLSKGRPLSRKRKDWRLRVPLDMLKRVTLYVPLS